MVKGLFCRGSRSLLILMGAQFWRETVGDEPLLQKSDFYHGQTEVGEVGDRMRTTPPLSPRGEALPQTAHSHLFGIGRMWIWI